MKYPNLTNEVDDAILDDIGTLWLAETEATDSAAKEKILEFAHGYAQQLIQMYMRDVINGASGLFELYTLDYVERRLGDSANRKVPEAT